MCNIHAHLVLMLRNIKPHELNEVSATTILAGMAYLATRHQWNKGLLDVWDGEYHGPLGAVVEAVD